MTDWPMTDWEARYAKERAVALAGFDRAKKRALALIAKLARGEPNEAQVSRSIAKLEDLTSGAVIRGDRPTSDQAHETIRLVREAFIAAREAGYVARRAANDREIARLDEQIREKRRNQGSFERELEHQRLGLPPPKRW